MYNRYIGNTGKFYRVEEAEDIRPVPPPPPTPEPVLDRREAPPRWEQVPEAYTTPSSGPDQASLTGPGWGQYMPPPPSVSEPPPRRSWWSRILGGEPVATSVSQAPPPPIPLSDGVEESPKFDLGGILQMPSSFRQAVRERLPESLDLGDILLVLVLIYLFLEGDDDDMLIILGVLVVSWVWPLFRKDE